MAGGAGIVDRPIAAVDADVSQVSDGRKAVGICDHSAAAAVVPPVARPGRLIKPGSGAVRTYGVMRCDAV